MLSCLQNPLAVAPAAPVAAGAVAYPSETDAVVADLFVPDRGHFLATAFF